MEKFVLSKMKSDNFSKACNEIYLLTDYNEKQYPEYYKWFYSKNIPRVLNGKGDMIQRRRFVLFMLIQNIERKVFLSDYLRILFHI